MELLTLNTCVSFLHFIILLSFMDLIIHSPVNLIKLCYFHFLEHGRNYTSSGNSPNTIRRTLLWTIISGFLHYMLAVFTTKKNISHSNDHIPLNLGSFFALLTTLGPLPVCQRSSSFLSTTFIFLFVFWVCPIKKKTCNM